MLQVNIPAEELDSDEATEGLDRCLLFSLGDTNEDRVPELAPDDVIEDEVISSWGLSCSVLLVILCDPFWVLKDTSSCEVVMSIVLGSLMGSRLSEPLKILGGFWGMGSI